MIVTIHLNEGWSIDRRSSGRQKINIAEIGKTIILGPGAQEWKVGTGAPAHLLQLRMTTPELSRYLEEDHDDRRGFSAIRRVDGDVDLTALRLCTRALLTDGSAREVMLRELVAHLVDERSSSAAMRSRGISPTRMRRVWDLLSSDLANVTLARMAGEAGLSVFHFAREFRQETGETPWNYVRQLRVWTALNLLDGRTPVRQVTRAVGFVDASHLGRAVRHYLGTSTSTAHALLYP